MKKYLSIALCSFYITLWSHISFAEEEADLESYKAVYKISLEDRDYQSMIDNISGKMLYELEKTCQGWILRQNTVTHFIDVNGDRLSTRSNYVIWESLAHDELKFYYRYFSNGQLIDEISGYATLSEENGYYAQFDTPFSVKIKLPKNIIFPIKHLKLVTKLLKKENPIGEHQVFDGTTLDHGYLINSIAHNIKNNPASTAPFGLPFSKKKYAVHMAYYDQYSLQSKTTYVTDIDMSITGIQYQMISKYHDFSVRTEMKKFESIETTSCLAK